MLQFASQLVEAALTTAKQLWGTKTINTDSLLHPEPTCSLLRVAHREATPTSTLTITVHVHTQRHTHICKHTRTSLLFHRPEFLTFPPGLLHRWSPSLAENCHHVSPCLLYINNALISLLPYSQGWRLSLSLSSVGGPSVPSLAFSHCCSYLCVIPARRPPPGSQRSSPSDDQADARHTQIPPLTHRLYTLTPLFHIAVLLMHPCSYSRSIWCMCQAWGGGLTDYIKLQCGKRAQRCQSGPCDGRSVEQ